MEPLFEIGKVIATPGALEMIGDYGVIYVVNCHAHSNYGNVSDTDKKLNDWAIEHGERIVSTYSGIWEKSVFVVTERDRSVTTVLLAEEY
ncbi:hypothetical protein [Paenibacillus sp. URB8-2]|uniref:hypothetical protein n=1 Tax=Paenibacillus sp. URB8-2 TaxID=2741301 RepID=UPI0015B979E9|nr:hypothetical protein [Paenibacillus sp. URB8-2]BCG56754.1 hypothetical protein PUR_01790 [Paenibacillus sp. URB8-2]